MFYRLGKKSEKPWGGGVATIPLNQNHHHPPPAPFWSEISEILPMLTKRKANILCMVFFDQEDFL